jgi:hypothetical protein
VFGGRPGPRPDLYVANPDGSVGPQLKIGSGGVHEDVPRVPNGDGTYTALLGDPRNDENLMIAGLHCAHILFYNRVLDELSEFDLARFPAARAGERSNPCVAFLIARQISVWHYYQWLLVNEHLPQIAGQQVVNDALQNGNRFYNPPPGGCFYADRLRRRGIPLRAPHGPPLVSRELHLRHRRQLKPDRRPVLWAGVRRLDPGRRVQRAAEL